MSQSNSETKIISSVSLMSFAVSHGKKVMVSEFVNKTTGETFTKLAFPNAKHTKAAGDLEGKIITASWGPSLPGGLTAKQVGLMKDELQILETERPEHFVVAKQGQLRGEDVDLGL